MTSFIVTLSQQPVNKKCTVLSESYDFLYLVDGGKQIKMVSQFTGAHFAFESKLIESVTGNENSHTEALAFTALFQKTSVRGINSLSERATSVSRNEALPRSSFSPI
jgi:hypothetical protein